MDDRSADAQDGIPPGADTPPGPGRWSLRPRPRRLHDFGADAAARREIERRSLHRPDAGSAPEFHRHHADLDLLAAGACPAGREAVVRVLEVAAAMLDDERDARARLQRDIAERVAAAEQTLAQQADDAGLPRDTQAALEDAISACGRMNHVAARRRLGDRLYEAIAGLGHGCGWSWICQQPAVSMAHIARRIDQRLGRDHTPSSRPSRGGGTHFRRPAKGRRVPVPKEALPAMLLGLVRGSRVFVPIEELADYRLTAGDWNFLVGQVLKKIEMGFLAQNRFAAYLLESVRRHEENHRIHSDDRQETP